MSQGAMEHRTGAPLPLFIMADNSADLLKGRCEAVDAGMSLRRSPEFERLTLTRRISGEFCKKREGQYDKNVFFPTNLISCPFSVAVSLTARFPSIPRWNHTEGQLQ